MKYIIVALAGAADQAGDDLYSKTPLEVAKIPYLNRFAKAGRVGTVKLMTPELSAYPETGILSLLGLNPKQVYTGRGPLEAANLDLDLEDNEIPFRVNFITESDGHMMDPTAGGISTKESKALINYLNKKVSSDFVRFYAGSEHRHVAVLKDSHGYDALSAKTVAPDSIIGEKIDHFFPKGPGEELLRKLMYDARLLLQDHEINQVRVDLQENPANMIWLWGQGRMPEFKKFSELFGQSALMLSDQEFVKGSARLSGFSVADLPEPTYDLQEDLTRMADALFEVLKERDCVFCHLNFCDQASYDGALKQKISALEASDFFLFSKLHQFLEMNDDVRLMITPVYKFSCAKQKRLADPAPVVMVGKNLPADEIEKFTELAAESSSLKYSSGAEMLHAFFSKA